MEHALTMTLASDKRAIEDNAANWTAQAVILQRVEDIVEAERISRCALAVA